MTAPRILVLAGSARADSLNRKLARVGAEALTKAGATVDLLELGDIAMPLYDGDLEAAEGLPPGAVAFKERLAAADGFMFVSPEYNGSIPGHFKNAIDWASRGDDVFSGKVVGLMAASPGRLGGNRMMSHLRHVLGILGCWVVPDHVAIAQAGEAFDAQGQLSAPFHQKQVAELAAGLVDAIGKFTHVHDPATSAP